MSDERAQGELRAAEESLRAGDAIEALRRADEALGRRGDDPEAHLVRARALLALGRLGEAKLAAQASLRLRLGHRPAKELIRQINQRLAPAASGAAAWSPGGRLLDEFVVERLLGRGGMGEVFLVREGGSGRRFAVKTIAASALGEEASRRALYRELQTWIDLPEHPHLVACRFFRTLDDRLLIFAEYVDGGSLQRWIEDRRLVDLASVLDVATQLAWGLHAAHQTGVIHQDIKPANVLLSRGRQVKVTDFGLARARPVAAPPPAGGALVSLAGMTPAYCSPEQAGAQALTHATDVWSFGLTVLEMFVGEPPCRFGAEARQALDEHTGPGKNKLLLPLPEEMFELLARCFRASPGERWGSMAELALRLQRLHERLLGRPHGRLTPSPTSSQPPSERERQVWGAAWSDPELWRRQVIQAKGGSDAPPAEPAPSGSTSRQAQAIEDLAAYDDLKRRLERRAAATGRDDLAEMLARLCMDKALIHSAAGDPSGCFACYDQAITLWKRLLEQGGNEEAARLLASAYTNQAALALGDSQMALFLHDQGVRIREWLAAQQGTKHQDDQLAMAYTSKANTLYALGNPRAALDLYEQALAILAPMVEQQGRRDLACALANVYQNKALAAGTLGDHAAARSLCDRALAALEPPGERTASNDAALTCAMILRTKADTLMSLGALRETLGLYERSVEIWERLVLQKGRRDLAYQLAVTRLNQAESFRLLGDYPAALELCGRALDILAPLVEQQGHSGLAPMFALALRNKAMVLAAAGDHQASLLLHDQALDILKTLVDRGGHPHLSEQLAVTYINKAVTLAPAGDVEAALDLYDRALAILVPLVEQGRGDLANAVAIVYQNKVGATFFTGDPSEHHQTLSRAIAIWERLVYQEGHREFLGDLAVSRAYRAKTLELLGQLHEARDEARWSFATLQAELARTGRADLAQVLALAQQHLGAFLQEREG